MFPLFELNYCNVVEVYYLERFFLKVRSKLTKFNNFKYDMFKDRERESWYKICVQKKKVIILLVIQINKEIYFKQLTVFLFSSLFF